MTPGQKLLALRAEAHRLSRDYDAAEAAGNDEEMERIAMKQFTCDDAIEEIEARLDYVKHMPSHPGWRWGAQTV